VPTCCLLSLIPTTHAARERFAAQACRATIGVWITDLQPDRCEIALTHDPCLTPRHGFIHGGVVATLADASAGYAAFSLMQALAQVLEAARNLPVCESSLFAPGHGGKTRCARPLVSLITLMPPTAGSISQGALP